MATTKRRARASSPMLNVRYYDNVSELPMSVKKSLPAKAQRMYMHVYNSGVSRYDNPARVAWAVVSKYYERPLVRGRKWTRRPHTRTGKSDDDDENDDDTSMSDYYDFMNIFETNNFDDTDTDTDDDDDDDDDLYTDDYDTYTDDEYTDTDTDNYDNY
ncbi:unknown [Orgyia leucostigma nucleopolyhedrovirus]|uniref:Uncharacterized protein n=1 Tax=Orgyia leucostigma nucleopolyhedrovirus TaxID=490711 RepID=B0FDY9_9ABAC|nr:unknown [Orgyia leucostigma nucleopolyhedrovirus]ABY65847.1 unknown [Orgyia leucostigma nucleopolyhedrovirus]